MKKIRKIFSLFLMYLSSIFEIKESLKYEFKFIKNYSKLSDVDRLRGDFIKVGNDIRKAMKVEFNSWN
ncbi:MAG: hypothetical protein IJU40_02300, partial [Desulfovibrionaceae bacterium]|nr:hypothetical protein [Desulfovibrionaceae bacterium]